MDQASLFVGPEGLAVRCSFTKNGLATGRQNQLMRAAVSVPFRGISWFCSLGGTHFETHRKCAKCTEMQRVSNHGPCTEV